MWKYNFILGKREIKIIEDEKNETLKRKTLCWLAVKGVKKDVQLDKLSGVKLQASGKSPVHLSEPISYLPERVQMEINFICSSYLKYPGDDIKIRWSLWTIDALF